MVEPEKIRHDGEVGIDDVWYDREQYYSKPDAGRIDKWREELSLAKRLRLEVYFASCPATAALGYDMPRHFPLIRLLLLGAWGDRLLRALSYLSQRLALFF